MLLLLERRVWLCQLPPGIHVNSAAPVIGPKGLSSISLALQLGCPHAHVRMQGNRRTIQNCFEFLRALPFKKCACKREICFHTIRTKLLSKVNPQCL
eukprot:4542053-Amphidinium_carterae.1